MGLPVAVASFLSSRIPFLLSNAIAFHVTTTAPNEPPKQSEQDAVKKGRWERIFASTISWLPPLAKLSVEYLTLCECAVIVRAIWPHSALSSLVPTFIPTPDPKVTPLFILGWFMTTAGTALRLASYRALGKLFTFELSIREDHVLVTSGPYAYVRHPSYTALLLIVIGCYLCQLGHGSLVGEWIKGTQPATKKVLGALWAAMWVFQVGALVGRTKKEDDMLRKEFGKDWDEWAKRVPARLIPFFF
ncbi:hypothetical protein HWV62_37105 [Athelia sp. TMB]|nr:hypothetical protein HWV62_37105 [Athelia sp. TMB]